MLEQLSVVLGILAGAVQLYGYWVYNTQSPEKISTGSWAIWAFGGIVDLVSYAALTEGDLVLNILPAVCALAAIATFCYALWKRRLDWPDKIDGGFVVADCGIAVIWYFTSTVTANLLFQVSAFASYFPLWRGQVLGRERELPLPWTIWTVAYSLLAVSVILRLGQEKSLAGLSVDLAYPVTHGVACLIVVLIAVRTPRPAR